MIADETVERMRRYQPSEEEKLTESPSLDQLKAVGRKIEADEQQKQTNDQEQRNALVFRELHPECRSTDGNTLRMIHFLRSRNQTATLENQAAYIDLRTVGLLEIDATVERELEMQSIRSQADEIRHQRANQP